MTANIAAKLLNISTNRAGTFVLSPVCGESVVRASAVSLTPTASVSVLVLVILPVLPVRAVGDSEVAGGDIAVGGDLQQSSVDTATDVKTRQIEEQIIVDGQRCIGHGHIPQQGELDIGYGWSKVVWIGYRGL